MFSSIFGGKSEKYKVTVHHSFVESDVDMGGMTYTKTVSSGETGVASINGSGKVSIKMDTVTGPYYSSKMKLSYPSKEHAEVFFKFEAL